ncbi:hypothetical protein Tco_0250661 [Tanacetum coccineum]
MSPQEIQLVVARDEQWVPSAERVKISSTNIRLETAVPQKEETLQVVIDIIKNSTCFRAFTISADILEIFMQTILDICPTVEGVDFTDVPNDDAALTFLIDLSYKGPLNWHTNMFVDHMHRPWRTLAAIINKCLSRKTTSNDKLKKSRIDILWGMFNRENVHQTFQTHQIPPKKSRGKGSQGKKTADTLVEEVKVSEEFDPKLAKRKTSSKRRVKKKATLSADDNIIYDDLMTALGIVTESISESAKKKSRGRSSKSVIIQDTLSTPKSKPATSKAKLKGVPSLTPEEQEAADIKQALKESKKTSRRKPGTGGSNEGTGSIPGILDESTIISTTSSEGTGSKIGVLDEEKDITEEKVIPKWGDKDDDNDDVEKDDKDGDADDEGDDHVSDIQDADDEDDKTESV